MGDWMVITVDNILIISVIDCNIIDLKSQLITSMIMILWTVIRRDLYTDDKNQSLITDKLSISLQSEYFQRHNMNNIITTLLGPWLK